MNIRGTVSWLKERMQVDLFPHLAEVFTDPMTEKHEKAAKKRGVKEEEKAKMKEKVKQRGRPKKGAIREDGVEKKDVGT